ILEESFSGTGYGFQQETRNNQDRAIWSRRDARGPQSLFYKLSVYRADENGLDKTPLTMPAVVRKPDFGSIQQESMRLAAESIIARAHQLSADKDTLVRQLLKLLNDANNPDAIILRADYEDRSPVDLM